MDSTPFRLSDIIISRLDTDRVSTIMKLVMDEEGMTDEEKRASLIMTGVALGVDETQSHIDQRGKENIDFLGRIVAHIDEALDQAASSEVSAALAAVRSIVAERLADEIKHSLSAFAAKSYTLLGVPGEVLLGGMEAKDQPTIDLIGIAAEVMRRHPRVVLGWHHAMTHGYPKEMVCHCTPCHHRLFDSLSTSEEVATRQMLVDFGGMDAALAEFGIFMINDLREEAARISRGLSNLHEVDPQASEQQYKDIMSRIKEAK